MSVPRDNRTWQGDVVGDVMANVGDNITGVDIITWGVKPGVFTALLVIFVLFYLIGIDVNVPIKANQCDTIKDPDYKGPNVYDRKGRDVTPSIRINCVDVYYSGYWKAVGGLFAAAVIGGIVGKYTYMLGLANANRKAAAGISGVYATRSALGW